MTQLATVTAGAGADTVVNQNFDAVSAAAMYGRRAPATAGLTWAYYGGRGFGNTIADGTVALTASTTNYVVASRSTGAVSVATSTTNWNDTTNYFRVRLIVTGAASITTDTDYREFGGGTTGGGGSSAWGDLTGVPSPIEDIAALTDPGADRLLFWDDSASEYTHLALGTNLSITGTTLNAAGGGGAAWGGITGTLTDQADLVSALAAKQDTSTIGETIDDRVAGLLVAGTGITLTYNDGLNSLTIAASGGGGGLTGFTSSLNTASPNDTVNASRILASGGTGSQDAVMSAKGFGALLAQLPDGTAAGGNKRGSWAVDWQMSRSVASRVASGSSSVIGGGNQNTASGSTATVAGGTGNTASGLQSFVGGGGTNTASGQHAAISGGTGNTATGTGASVSGGASCQASGDYSRAGGNGARARGIMGADVYGCFGSNAIQRGTYILARQTSSASPEVLTVDNASPSATNQIVLQDTSTFSFQGTVSAQSAGGVDKAGWVFAGMISRGYGEASTALVGTPTVTLLGSAGGGTAWTFTVSADKVLGGLKLTVTGIGRWGAEIRTAEVIYG